MKKLSVLIVVAFLFCSATTVMAMQIQSATDSGGDKIISSSNLDDIIPIILEQLDVSMMFGYIEDIVSITEQYPVNARVTGTDGCEETAEYIQEQFTGMGLNVRQHHWSAKGKYGIWQYITFDSWNVEAKLPGINDDNEQVYIISAHYDTVFSTPGADDDAAGVAAVLSAAKILSQYEFNHTIRFVTFSGEEQGLLGSESYAKYMYDKNANIIAMLNGDMMGYTETEEDGKKVRIYEDESSDWIGDVSVAMSQQYYDYIGFDEVVRSYDPSGHGSDYISFWRFAYDAIFNHEYRWNPNKDTPDDTIENMDVIYATKVAKFMLATLAKLAMSPIIENTPPDSPDAPEGESKPKINVEYTYTTSAIDPDGDQVYYLFDWGDGTNSGWVGPYASEETGQASHAWSEEGSYKIQAKAKDEHRILSQWSAQTSVGLPKVRQVSNLRFMLMRMIEAFLTNILKI